MQSGSGVIACVTPQNWLFLGNDYKNVRRKRLPQSAINGCHSRSASVPGAFLKRLVVRWSNVASLVALKNCNPTNGGTFFAADFSRLSSISEKVFGLKLGELSVLLQNPDQTPRTPIGWSHPSL